MLRLHAHLYTGYLPACAGLTLLRGGRVCERNSLVVLGLYRRVVRPPSLPLFSPWNHNIRDFKLLKKMKLAIIITYIYEKVTR